MIAEVGEGEAMEKSEEVKAEVKVTTIDLAVMMTTAMAASKVVTEANNLATATKDAAQKITRAVEDVDLNTTTTDLRAEDMVVSKAVATVKEVGMVMTAIALVHLMASKEEATVVSKAGTEEMTTDLGPKEEHTHHKEVDMTMITLEADHLNILPERAMVVEEHTAVNPTTTHPQLNTPANMQVAPAIRACLAMRSACSKVVGLKCRTRTSMRAQRCLLTRPCTTTQEALQQPVRLWARLQPCKL